MLVLAPIRLDGTCCSTHISKERSRKNTTRTCSSPPPPFAALRRWETALYNTPLAVSSSQAGTSSFSRLRILFTVDMMVVDMMVAVELNHDVRGGEPELRLLAKGMVVIRSG